MGHPNFGHPVFTKEINVAAWHFHGKYRVTKLRCSTLFATNCIWHLWDHPMTKLQSSEDKHGDKEGNNEDEDKDNDTDDEYSVSLVATDQFLTFFNLVGS